MSGGIKDRKKHGEEELRGGREREEKSVARRKPEGVKRLWAPQLSIWFK